MNEQRESLTLLRKGILKPKVNNVVPTLQSLIRAKLSDLDRFKGELADTNIRCRRIQFAEHVTTAEALQGDDIVAYRKTQVTSDIRGTWISESEDDQIWLLARKNSFFRLLASDITSSYNVKFCQNYIDRLPSFDSWIYENAVYGSGSDRNEKTAFLKKRVELINLLSDKKSVLNDAQLLLQDIFEESEHDIYTWYVDQLQTTGQAPNDAHTLAIALIEEQDPKNAVQNVHIFKMLSPKMQIIKAACPVLSDVFPDKNVMDIIDDVVEWAKGKVLSDQPIPDSAGELAMEVMIAFTE
ncbi:hypothetical protein [uncultured Endozoicomonas sp.]|uniref:hypothetical protein n=1 Tax=uncultured Endozoicomonas sp. TaxID=432652 RepID=UPI00260EA46D|nr:hypothetical protein [uncultured Endozoicomonas sp.]